MGNLGDEMNWGFCAAMCEGRETARWMVVVSVQR